MADGFRHDDIQQFLNLCCQQKLFPGAALCVYYSGHSFFVNAGTLSSNPQSPPVASDTIFDLASLTKPVATTTAILQLAEKEKIQINSGLSTYLTEFSNAREKKDITLYHLLSHTSGLPAWEPLYIDTASRGEMVLKIARMPLLHPVGSRVEYSCLGFILLAETISRVTGLSVQDYCDRHIFKPLNMTRTFFNPPSRYKEDIAPTEFGNAYERSLCNKRGYHFERWRDYRIQGEVHDGNAFYGGGETGNAGLFSTSSDLAAFATSLLGNGMPKYTVLKQAFLRMATANQTPGLNSHRGLGWQMADSTSATSDVLSDTAFGHCGFTGTSFWIDPVIRCAVILLTNRVYFTGNGEDFNAVRAKVHRMVMESIGSQPDISSFSMPL